MAWLQDLVRPSESHKLIVGLGTPHSQPFHRLYTGPYNVNTKTNNYVFHIEIQHQQPRQREWSVEMLVRIELKKHGRQPEEKEVDYARVVLNNKQPTLVLNRREEYLRRYLKYDDDNIFGTLELDITLTVMEQHGLPELPFKMEESRQYPHVWDVVLIVEGRQVEVLKEILCSKSKVFDRMFCGDVDERQAGTVEIEDVKYEDFVKFIGLFYGYDTVLDVETCDVIIHLCDRFQAPLIREKYCKSISYLHMYELIQFLLLARKHKVEELQNTVAKCVKSAKHLKEVMSSEEFSQLTSSDQNYILNNLITNMKSCECWSGDNVEFRIECYC